MSAAPTLVDFEAGLDGDQPAEALRRWNAHDELVAALRDAIDVMDVHDASPWAIDAARAALAKATA